MAKQVLSVQFPAAQPEPDHSHKLFGVKRLRTLLVENKAGDIFRINERDFDTKRHWLVND